MTLILQPDFEFAAKDVKEFLALVCVRFAAAAAGFNAKKMRLHGHVAPSQEFHADFRAGLQNFAVRWTDERRSVAVGLEKREEIGFVEARDATKSRDRRAHLAALECAQKAYGDAGGAGDLGEGQAPLLTQASKTLTGRLARIGGSNRKPLFFQNVNNGCRIQAPRAAKKDGALEQANVRFGVQSIAAQGTLGGDETERLPRTQSRRRDAQSLRNLGDAQEVLVG